MPALRLFGRRWGLADDDLLPAAVVELFIRIIWCGFVIGAIIQLSGCSYYATMQIYYYATLVMCVMLVFIDGYLTYLCTRGSIVIHRERRRFIPHLAYCRIAAWVPEIAVDIFGSMLVFSSYFGDFSDAIAICSNTTVGMMALWMARIIVVFSWIQLLVSCCIVLVVFDPLAGFNSEARIAAWERRCRLLCCCFLRGSYSDDADALANSSDEATDFSYVGRLLADYLVNEDDLDLVTSDVAAGLVLVSRRRYELTHGPPHPATSPPTEWMTVEKARYFLPFASAMYGWPFYVAHRRGRCCTWLASHTAHLRHRRRPSQQIAADVVLGDDIWGKGLSALIEIASIDANCIVLLDLTNKLYQLPFLVYADHKSMSIVVSIRGTLSMVDAFTDIMAKPEPFTELQQLTSPASASSSSSSSASTSPYYAHRGMYRTAQAMITRLVGDGGLLVQALQRYPECNRAIVVTGHSLGAGVAALLALLLSAEQQRIRRHQAESAAATSASNTWWSLPLQCFSYAPPGALVSRSVNEDFCANLICAVALAEDVVPRLSIPAMRRLKGAVAQELRNCRQPKFRILGGFLFRCLTRCFRRGGGGGDHHQEDLAVAIQQDNLAAADELPISIEERSPLVTRSSSTTMTTATQSLLTTTTRRLVAIDDDNATKATGVTILRNSEGDSSEPELFPPGLRLMNVLEHVNAVGATSSSHFEITWCQSSGGCFSDIILGSNALRHHFPYVLQEALDAICSTTTTTATSKSGANATATTPLPSLNI